MNLQVNDILVSGNQNHWGNVCAGIRVIQLGENGIKARRVHYSYHGEEFFLTHQALETSHWKLLEQGQLPLL